MGGVAGHQCQVCQHVYATVVGFVRHVTSGKHPICTGDAITNTERKLHAYELMHGSACIDATSLRRMYHDEGKSVLDIAAALSVHHLALYRIFDLLQIERRSLSDAVVLSSAKREQTNVDRFGAKNVWSKESNAFERRNTTVQQRYGVTNVAKLPAVRKTISDRLKNGGYDKVLATKLAKYGYTSPWQVPEIHAKARRNSVLAHSRTSKLQRDIYDAIHHALPELQTEYQVHDGQRSYYFDARVGNLLIEFNGDYWHANPKHYSRDDIIPYPDGPKSASEIWARDAKKHQVAQTAGYDLIVIWEDDWKQHRDTEMARVMQRCKECT